MFIRVNETDSLVNGHVHFPPCLKAKTNLPAKCDCGNSNAINCASMTADTGTMTSASMFNTRGTSKCHRR